jgi:peptide/nickel transport system permease protein
MMKTKDKQPMRPRFPINTILLWFNEIRSVMISSPRIMIGSTLIIIFILMAVLAPVISPYDPLKMNLRNKYQPPSSTYLLGTDVLGRDILSRIIWGTRISLQTALGSVAIGMIVGIMLGISAGYFGGTVDAILGRVLDVMLAFPSFVLSIVIVASLGRGLLNMILAIGISISPQLARLVRGVALYVKENQFVEASKSFAISDWRIIFRHIFPHTLTPVVVYCTLSLGTAVLIEAALSFLGLGLSPPTPSWGKMVDEGRYVLRSLPWFSTSAGGFIMVVVLGFNLLGDGLRDHLDPRLRGGVQ